MVLNQNLLIIWWHICFGFKLITLEQIIDCQTNHWFRALWEGCAVVAMFCRQIVQTSPSKGHWWLDTSVQCAQCSQCNLCAASSTALHNFALSKEHFMDAARRGRVTPASVVLHCILRDTLFCAECNVRAEYTDMQISAWNDCFSGCTTTKHSHL